MITLKIKDGIISWYRKRIKVHLSVFEKSRNERNFVEKLSPFVVETLSHNFFWKNGNSISVNYNQSINLFTVFF